MKLEWQKRPEGRSYSVLPYKNKFLRVWVGGGYADIVLVPAVLSDGIVNGEDITDSRSFNVRDLSHEEAKVFIETEFNKWYPLWDTKIGKLARR
jgi:hypothetical protein